jgi:hypothetical protein
MHTTKVDGVHTIWYEVMKFCTTMVVHMRKKAKKHFAEIRSVGELWRCTCPKRRKIMKIGSNWRQTTSCIGNNPTCREIEVTEFIGDIKIYTGSGITANFVHEQ